MVILMKKNQLKVSVVVLGAGNTFPLFSFPVQSPHFPLYHCQQNAECIVGAL